MLWGSRENKIVKSPYHDVLCYMLSCICERLSDVIYVELHVYGKTMNLNFSIYYILIEFYLSVKLKMSVRSVNQIRTKCLLTSIFSILVTRIG